MRNHRHKNIDILLVTLIFCNVRVSDSSSTVIGSPSSSGRGSTLSSTVSSFNTSTERVSTLSSAVISSPSPSQGVLALSSSVSSFDTLTERVSDSSSTVIGSPSSSQKALPYQTLKESAITASQSASVLTSKPTATLRVALGSSVVPVSTLSFTSSDQVLSSFDISTEQVSNSSSTVSSFGTSTERVSTSSSSVSSFDTSTERVLPSSSRSTVISSPSSSSRVSAHPYQTLSESTITAPQSTLVLESEPTATLTVALGSSVVPVSPCIPNRCKNGGTCVVAGSNGFTCSCLVGYNGQRCQRRTSFWDNMYPFGSRQNDSELHQEQSLFYSYYHCLKIKTNTDGFPFFWKRHYKLYICRNGIIQLNYEWSWWWPYKFGAYRWLRNMAIIAPFWTPIDMYHAFETGRSKVFYHVYRKRGKDPAAKEILDMASQHVHQYQKNQQFANFKAKWVAVVTWENLCPYTWYRYWYYNRPRFTCPLANTFQAVIITDGVNTFLMYNYPFGHIQWVVPASLSNYRWWYGYYGLPVAGWNSGNNGRNYKNIRGSGTLYGMFDIDKRKGNTGMIGRYFWRIEDSIGKGAREKCINWVENQEDTHIALYYNAVMRSRRRFACPCSLWQAFFDRRFRVDWYSWPNLCAYSRRTVKENIFIHGLYVPVKFKQQCCYSTKWRTWGALKVGPQDGGHATVIYPKALKRLLEEFYTDAEAYRLCCVNSKLCDWFYHLRPSDDCSFYRPPRRRWFWGDPHFKTLDGKNYTFNGIGEYVMMNANEGFFQLQARTQRAQGNSTMATIFSAGAANEENTSTVEVRVKEGGGIDVLINGTTYSDYDSLTNQSVEVAGDLYVSKPEENCFESSFPSSTSVKFCEKKGMLSFVVTPSEDFKNATKGLLGTWNDDPDDDFTLPNGTVLRASLSLREIHFDFGVKWQINATQSLFSYGQGENVSTFFDPLFVPMFADNITWANDSFRDEAEARCGDDYACLFDAASTNDLSIGMATRNINIQLVNETNNLENFPPRIVHAPSVINATFGEVVEVNITAEDNDTITFQVINKPAGATVNTTGNILYFTWPVNSTQKNNITFVVTDSKGASTEWTPTINMCACLHDGTCVTPEEGDEANADSKFVYMGCACQGGYTGRFCDSDIDACESNGQPCYEGVECIDLPPPANTSGYQCGPCPSGYTGDGAKCADIDECENATLHNCRQVCVNVPASFTCECFSGYRLNADGNSCDDINECVPSNDCMQQCDNALGTYNCSCNQYFSKDPDDWKRCLPENPCSAGHGCSQVCFKGENNEPTCTCDRGYQLESDGKTCKDIDECDPDKPVDRCNQICENTPGSYTCECLKGFELNKDGFQCEDVNECLDIDSFNCTDEFHRCVNTRGSYKCECEVGLYWIDGKCRGLEKNETTPVPNLPKPREPSEKEREQAVELSLFSDKALKWDFKTDKAFKIKTASVVSIYCTNNRERCGLKKTRLQRRELVLDLYSADQVHLLPGYPRSSSVFLQVAFYVQKPPGLVTDVEVIWSETLVQIVNVYKYELEIAVGANISNVRALFKPTKVPTGKPAEKYNEYWKWIAIGVGAGVVLIIVIIMVCCYKGKKRKTEVEPTPELHHQDMSISHYKGTNLEEDYAPSVATSNV